MKHRSRIASLDSLRGLAATFVMVWHFTSHFFNEFPEYPKPAINFSGGLHAVFLFFAISGYVIPMTLERIDSPWEFLKARFMRLYPTFIVAVFITFGVLHFIGLPYQKKSLTDLAANLVMMPTLLGAGYIEGAYWSLEAELFFYAVMALIIWAKWKDKMDWIAVALIAPLIIDKILMKVHPPYVNVVNHVLFLQYSAEFVLGICIYYWNKEKKKRFLLIALLDIPVLEKLMGHHTGLVGVAILVVLYLATNDRLRFLENKVLLYLGTISYSLYLIHSYIGYAIIAKLLGYGVNPNVAILVAIAVALIMGTLLTFYVERPSLAWYKARRAAKALEAPLPLAEA